MAKVYSWEISEKPKKYAYIVHPQDNTIPYIGNTELSGTNLEKVKNWASTCTDDKYEAQFKILVETCEKRGLNVKFETATAYTDIESSCDNLRGPAGKGIDYISSDTDVVRNINIYKIHYTDGTSYTFEIQNGKDGHDGIDGSPGAKGDSGISSKFVMIYTSGTDQYGDNFTPVRPEGGSYDFSKNKLTYPIGWGANDGTIIPPVWMSSRTFSTSENYTDKEWSQPIQITGDAGAPGKDGVSVEFIYYLDDNKPNVDSLESPNKSGYIPPIESGWKTSPTGVDENNLTEWCSIRKYNQEKKEWGPWGNPVIWSKYGVDGQDGDGIQYIYLKNRGEIPENPTPNDFINNESYQNGDNEWIPEPDSRYINKYGKIVQFAPIEVLPGGSTAKPAGVWTDNPTDITAEFHSQWVATRKYRKNDSGKYVWEAYSDPTLWSKFGQDGKNATSVRRIYAISTSTSNPPDLPIDSTITGDWSIGFPTDYIAGENVVWGTEAEIWADNFDFVKSYKLVSEKNADGNIIAPPDSNDDNVKDVAEIPTEEAKGYKYVRFNGEYYEWTGGWCKPYLVTGLKGEKGENGNPVDYTAYVFAYGYRDYPPSAPTGNSIKHPGSSTDEKGNEVIWLDFPDTTGNKVDNAEMRWYQCAGFVNGGNGEVKEWGHVYPCNGQDGQDGQALPGRYTEFRFGVTKTSTKPELIEYNDLGYVYREPPLYDDNGNQVGWFTTDENLPDIPTGGAMWQIWALIDGSDDSVIINNNKAWNGPIRISGERGEQGIQGPVGMRGVSGIPGSKSLNMYCLGTYGKNSTSKSYWETGDGYFGSEDWKNGVTPDKMTDWYLSTEMPYSDAIEVTTEEELDFETGKTENKGRVIKFIDTSKVEDNISTFETVTHTYFLVKHDNTIAQLTEPLSLAESEDFNIYVWCIQGNEVWKEIESNDVQHALEKIEWGSPFKLQGTNGLRGLTGSRGQVVYPMGVYNHEEVYITTEDKAPYVYDPNDGMFYVYNRVDEPWVGRLPGYNPDTNLNDGTYKTIIKHPDDAEGNFKVVDENPETNQTEQDTEFKYLYYDNKYYSWNGKQYVVASKYKYSIDGSGNEGTWMSDQQGDTPASNYINATNDNYKPAWVKFESFQALYTSIGIIENGMIGSAVYNNEFMFSQQGYAQDGITQTNYAVVSGKNTSYGFLSGYEYDERGEYKNDIPTGRHWKYKGTNNFIDNIAVNPYEQDANEKYIHTFLPNVCINFSTGQMWLSTGKIKFGGLDNRNVLTIEETQNRISEASEALSGIIESNKLNLQTQIDRSANTYYQAEDPSSSWQITNSQELTTYAPERIGDLWFNSTTSKSYIFAYTEDGPFSIISDRVLNSTNQTLVNEGYYWIVSDVPDSVYNRINSRSKIFIEEPTTPYYVGDLWFVHSDEYKEEEFYDGPDKTTTGINQGTCMVCMVTRESGSFTCLDWGKRDKYADEADVENAKEELASINNKLDTWSNDNFISPTERLSLKNEYNSVIAESSSIIAQAFNCGLSGTREYIDYITAFSNAKRTFEYYISDENVTVNKLGIEIQREGEYDYNNIKSYYEKRQLLLQKISDTLNGKIENVSKSFAEFSVGEDSIFGKVTKRVSDLEGNVKDLSEAGFLVEEDFASLFAQELEGEGASAIISAAVKDGIGTATISADKVNIGGDVNINEVLKVDDSIVTISNAKIDDCDITNVEITNVTINGSLRSPFVLDDNDGKVESDLHDNIVCHSVNSNATQLHNAVPYNGALIWGDPKQNGRIVRIANGLWKKEGNETTEKSVGLVKLEAPSEKKDFTFRVTKGTWPEPQTLTNLPSGIGNYIAYSNVRTHDVNESISSWEDRTATLTIPPGVKTYTFYVKRELKRTNNSSGDLETIADGSGTPLEPIPILSDVDSYIITTPDKSENITVSSQWKPISITVPNITEEYTIQITHRRNKNSIYNTSTAYIVLPEILLTGYFFENGIATTNLILSREVVELTGFGFDNEFYGWIVTNRSDFNPEGKYGQPLKLIAGGRLYYEYNASTNKYMPKVSCYSPYNRYKSNGVLKGFGFISYEKGKYILVFNDSYADFKWKDILDDPGTVIMATGYNRILEDDLSGYGEAPSKACVTPRIKALVADSTYECGYKIPTSGSGTRDYPGFEVWISDDTSCNYGGFNFMIYNISDIKGQPI